MTTHTYTAVRLTTSDALVKLNQALAAVFGAHEPRNRHERRAAAKKRRRR